MREWYAKCSASELPTGYVLAQTVDMVKDRKLMWRINGAALVIALAVLLLSAVFGPSLAMPPWQWLLMAALVLVYIVLHEGVHGIFIRIFCGRWGGFGFKGAYAYAGSDAYFAKVPYVIIALSPVVFWGIVLQGGMMALPNLFWPLAFVQMVNLSGAVGDYYICYCIAQMPGDVLVRDEGTVMRFYTKEENA